MLDTLIETTAAPTAVNAEGRYLAVLIDAGEGSSGTYPPDVLERAATDRVFPRGLHVYWDHATDGDGRPERTLRDLAGVLTEDATWDPTRQALVGPVQVFAPYRPLVEEMRDHIGLSINGRGELDEQRVVRRLTTAQSVDFVTRAGRGGRVLPVLEADRPAYDPADLAAFDVAGVNPPSNPGSPPRVTEAARGQEGAPVAAEDTELRESVSRLTTQLRESEAATLAVTGERDEARSELDVLRAELEQARADLAAFHATEAARPVIADVLAGSTVLAEGTRARLTRDALRALPITEGRLDETALRAALTEARTDAETEASAYLTEAGRPRGLGDTTTPVQESGDAPDEYLALFGQKG